MRKDRLVSIVAFTVAGLVVSAVCAQGQVTRRVSIRSDGTQGNGASASYGAVSADGRVLVFASAASNLVVGDTNDSPDVFVRDLASQTTTRVSVSSAGGSHGGTVDGRVAISANGRFVAFSCTANSLVAGDTNNRWDVFVHDRQTATTTRVSVGTGGTEGTSGTLGSFSVSLSDDARFVAFTSDLNGLGGGATSGRRWVYVHDRQTGATERVPAVAADAGADATHPALSSDGSRVAFSSAGAYVPGTVPSVAQIFVRDRLAQITTQVSPLATPAPASDRLAPSISGDGRFVVYHAAGWGIDPADTSSLTQQNVYLRDLSTGTTTRVSRALAAGVVPNGVSRDAVISRDGNIVAFNSSSNNLVDDDDNARGDIFAVDLRTRQTRLESRNVAGRPATGGQFGSVTPALDSDGDRILFRSDATDLVAADTNGVDDHFVRDVTGETDGDEDTLPDSFETAFGLNPDSGVGDDGPDGDPDGDALTNQQEWAAGSHPRGFVKRYFAEGAQGAFFSTRFALLNVNESPAHVLVRLQRGDGTSASRAVRLAPRSRDTLVAPEILGAGTHEFATIVESDLSVVADRTMTWGGLRPYGSHAESSLASPAPTWYLAEGATHSGFALFYLLQNPNPTPVPVTVRYLLGAGAPLTKVYLVPGLSRETIWVNNEARSDPALAALAATDVSAEISVAPATPIIVERAMYLSRPGIDFAAGHGSAGVTAPSLTWFLAEGATGPYFDEFVLVANPQSQDAAIRATYLLPSGTTLTKDYVVPANSRFNIWIDEEQFPDGSGNRLLADTAVSTTIDVTNDVPVIVERSMWWPGPTAATWSEAHNAPGTIAAATRWALAEGQVGGPDALETYVLIANTSAFSGTARVTFFFEDGTTTERTVALPGSSRTNVSVFDDVPEARGRRFGVLVESLGTTPAQVVVERAMYSSTPTEHWAAGTNARATPLP